jgi:trans-aconitate methyltransferase
MAARASDWDGVTYHRVSEPQFEWGQRVLARLDLRGDETVIDAGCGTGRLTAELLTRLPGGRVLAVDRSPSMLTVAERELRPRFGDRVSFLQADLLELDLDEAADVVFSTATFHWVLDHPRLFAVLHRALCPGGRLHAQCGGGPNLARVRGRAWRIAEQPEFAAHFAGWTSPWEYADAETTRDRLETAGFVDVATSLEPVLPVFADSSSYREFLRTVILRPMLDVIPDAALRDRFLDAMVEGAEDDDPPRSLDYWRLNLAGRRPV